MGEEIIGGQDPLDLSDYFGLPAGDGDMGPPAAHGEPGAKKDVAEPVASIDGLKVAFDPLLWTDALEKVCFPETLGAKGSKSLEGEEQNVELKFQIWIFSDKLRLTGRHKELTCETEFSLRNTVKGLPDGGTGFAISSARLLPFFYQMKLPLLSDRAPMTRRVDYSPYDGFEFEPAKAALHLRKAGAHYQLSTEAPFAPEPLPRVEQTSGTTIPSMKALTSALRSCLVIKNLKTNRRPVSACFEKGVCSALHPSRAVHCASEDLAGLDLSVPLKGAPKLVAMLRRLKDPCRLDFSDGRAVLDDGKMRCAFPADPGASAPFDLQPYLDGSANSAWKVDHAHLSDLSLVCSIVAGRGSNLDITVVDDHSGSCPSAQLECELIGKDGKVKSKEVSLHICTSDQTAKQRREARIRFRDFAVVVDKLRGPRIGLRIHERAVIFCDEHEGSVVHFLVPRTDPSYQT